MQYLLCAWSQGQFYQTRYLIRWSRRTKTTESMVQSGECSYINLNMKLVLHVHYNIYSINMIQFVIVFFAVIALFFLLLLVAITCAGWFGLSAYLKRFVNKYVSRSFDQEFRNVDRVPINS